MRERGVGQLAVAVLGRPLLLAAVCALAGAAQGSTVAFDTVPDRPPGELLPQAMVAGTNFRVADPVHGDGLMNRFVLDSRFGHFDAYGRAALAIRIQEVAALTELSRTSDVQIAGGGVVQGVEAQVKTATGVITHPVKTVTGIPKGVAHLFGGYQARGQEAMAEAKTAAAQVREDASGKPDSTGDAGAVRKTAAKGTAAARNYAEHYLGITAAERAYYRKLGVDPYTDNTVLRDAIRRDAKISAAAGFGMKFVGVPGIPGIGLTQRAVDAIYNEDPAVVRERTRKTLAGFGLSTAEIESFMNSPHLSPTRQVLLVSAAQALAGVARRGELLRHSIGLTSEEEVQVYLHSVGLLVKAHAEQPLESVVAGVRLPAALRTDHSVVVCGAFEALYWTPEVAGAEEQLRQALPGEAATRELRIAGTISARARDALRERGWTLREVSDQSE